MICSVPGLATPYPPVVKRCWWIACSLYDAPLFSPYTWHCLYFPLTWWRHQMKTFSALLALCAGKSPVTGEIPALYGDMSWVIPYTRHRTAAVRYWLRLTRMPRTRLTRVVFDWDYDLAIAGQPTWNRDILEIMTTCGIAEQFDIDNWRNHDPERILARVNTELTHLESWQWSVDGATMSRLRVFNDLVRPRTSEDPAGYVTADLRRRQRSLLAKLRSGTLPLAIEIGRYTRSLVDERLCRSCDSNAIETEFHFLFECNRYNDLKERFINTGDTGIRGINPPIEQLSLFVMILVRLNA